MASEMARENVPFDIGWCQAFQSTLRTGVRHFFFLPLGRRGHILDTVIEATKLDGWVSIDAGLRIRLWFM